jgi:hypothetical protein
MGRLRTVINALADLDLEPDELLARLNDTANRPARERAALPVQRVARRQPLTATCVYGVYDPFTRTCAVACAGHPPPLVVHPDVAEGPELGSFDTSPCAVTAVTSKRAGCSPSTPASSSRTGRSPGPPGKPSPTRTARSRTSATPWSARCPWTTAPKGSRCCSPAPAASSRTGSPSWSCRTIRRPPPSPGTSPATSSPPGASRRTRRTGAELIVSELATNAVRYGTPPLRLRLIRGETLTCEVHDTSPVTPHLRHARTVDEGGRGLFIVSQLADQWGTRYAGGG